MSEKRNDILRRMVDKHGAESINNIIKQFREECRTEMTPERMNEIRKRLLCHQEESGLPSHTDIAKAIINNTPKLAKELEAFQNKCIKHPRFDGFWPIIKKDTDNGKEI